MELINIKDVNVKYPNGVYAIKDFSVSIKKGDFVFVIGKTGSGKSTFIKMLYREVKPFNGEIILSGLNVAKLKNNKVVIKIVEIEVAIAIPIIPKYLERIIFNIIFNIIPILEFITGVLESLKE